MFNHGYPRLTMIIHDKKKLACGGGVGLGGVGPISLPRPSCVESNWTLRGERPAVGTLDLGEAYD